MLRAELRRLRERVARMDERGARWLHHLTEQDALSERLRAELDAARNAAEHLWFYRQEHGEGREWYPWLYELHKQKLADHQAAAASDPR